MTFVRRAVGAVRAEPPRLGAVRLDLGPVVVARLRDDVGPGTRVCLVVDDGLVVAEDAAAGT
jgi:hypothetical protein